MICIETQVMREGNTDRMYCIIPSQSGYNLNGINNLWGEGMANLVIIFVFIFISHNIVCLYDLPAHNVHQSINHKVKREAGKFLANKGNRRGGGFIDRLERRVSYD